MMKKIITIGIALMMVLTVLIGCNKKEEDPQDLVDNTPVYDPNAGIDFSSEKMFIVSSGSAQYTIVVAKEATEVEKFAASELVSFIRQSMGARLNIVTDDTVAYSTDAKYISIGKTGLLEQSNLNYDYSSLNSEGFFIKTVGNLILLDGANGRGTLYSVYDFLEKFVGVRFLTEDSTYVPEKTELYVHQMDIKEVPFFPFRTFSSANLQQNTYFAAQVRMSDVWAVTPDKYGGGYNNDAYQPNDHAFFDLLPPKVYGKDHPDWYNKSSASHNEDNFSQLCLTNEEMTGQAIINLIEWIKARPGAKYFMVGQMDMNPFCECENCQKSYEENGGKSGTLIIFINKLAKAVEEWQKVECPDREIIIQTFAYQQSLAPPIKYVEDKPVPVNENVVPRKNVMVKIAIDKACFFHRIDDPTCDSNIVPYRNIQEWNSLTDRLFLWEYSTNYTDFLVFFPHNGIMRENYITYQKFGVENMFTQNSCQAKEHYQGQLKCYLVSKLMWNPHRDVAKLIHEFNTLHFGSDIAPYIEDVYDRMEMHYKVKNFHGTVVGGAAYFEAANMPANLLVDCIATLEEALDAVEASDRSLEEKVAVSKRVKSFLVTPQYMLLRNYSNYYIDDVDGRHNLAVKFFDNMETIGMQYYKESGADRTTESLKAYYL